MYNFSLAYGYKSATSSYPVKPESEIFASIIAGSEQHARDTLLTIINDMPNKVVSIRVVRIDPMM